MRLRSAAMETRAERPGDHEAVRDVHRRAFDGGHGDVAARPAGSAAGAGLGFGKPSPRIPDAAVRAVTFTAHEPWTTGTLVHPATFRELDRVGLRDQHA